MEYIRNNFEISRNIPNISRNITSSRGAKNYFRDSSMGESLENTALYNILHLLLCCWEGRGVHRVQVGKPEEKKPLGRPRRRWEDNIKMDLQEVGGGCGDWMELAQDRDRWPALVNTVMNFRVPKMRGIS